MTTAKASPATLHDSAVIGAWFVLTRLWVTAFALLGATHPRPGHPHWNRADGILSTFVRWDAEHYLDIVSHGYVATSDAGDHHAAFFPLYPALVTLTDRVFHDPVLSAVLLSNLFALVAAFLIVRLAKTCGGDGRFAVILFLAAPGSNFLSFPYTESLFCLLVLAALLAIDRDWILLAGLLGALASATRPTGLVVAAALGAWMITHRSPSAIIRGALAGLLSCLGIVAHALTCREKFGDPLAFLHIQQDWGRHLTLLGPLRALIEFKFDPDYYVVTLLAIAGAIAMIRKSPLPATVAAWFLLMVPLATGTMMSMVRFQSANVPLIAGSASLVGRRWRVPLVAASLLVLAFETYKYSAGYPRN